MDDYRVVLAKRAKDDIMDIGDYITFTLLEPDISKKFIKDLRNSISQLKFFLINFHLFKIIFYQTKIFAVCPIIIIMFSTKLSKLCESLLF